MTKKQMTIIGYVAMSALCIAVIIFFIGFIKNHNAEEAIKIEDGVKIETVKNKEVEVLEYDIGRRSAKININAKTDDNVYYLNTENVKIEESKTDKTTLDIKLETNTYKNQKVKTTGTIHMSKKDKNEFQTEYAERYGEPYMQLE